jgi:Raf kinase inhibitor-like YbhB/YbcL family protein
MEVICSCFRNGEMIDKRYTCDGGNVNPRLVLENIPPEAKTLALIMDDPDAPGGDFVHWVVFDIPVTKIIEEDSVPGKQGLNDFKRMDYGGPCPPSGTHRYYFKIYALDEILNLEEGITKSTLENAMVGHTLAQTEIMGLYRKKEK